MGCGDDPRESSVGSAAVEARTAPRTIGVMGGVVTSSAALPAEARKPAEVYARIAQARKNLSDFGEFVFGWPCMKHHRRWCDALDDERIKRIIILGPPSSAKTTWPGVIYTARQLGEDPKKHMAYLSYGQEVAESRSVAIRDTMLSPEFRYVYPAVKPNKSAGWGEGAWYLRRSNPGDPDPTLRAASLWGGVLAYHYDEVVLDDPHDPEDVISKLQRLRTWRRVQSVLLPRLRPDARMVVTGFRWAEDDVPGMLMSEHGFHPDDKCNGKCGANGEEPEEWHLVLTEAVGLNKEGEEVSYWPQEWPLEKLKRTQREVGPSVFACQYQGKPAPEEGHIFKWFRRYGTLPADLKGIVVALDTAYTDTERSDYSAWSAWAYDGKPKPFKYLVEAGRTRSEMPEAEKMMGMFIRKIKVRFKLLPVRVVIRRSVAIDRIAAQHLKRTGINVTEVKIPGGDKAKGDLARLISPEFESYRARIPEDDVGGFWLAEWLHEHRLHDKGANDDFVETTIIAMRWFEQGKKVGVTRIPMRRREGSSGVPVASYR